MKLKIVSLIALMLALAGCGAPPPVENDNVVLPFIDDNTTIVARLDNSALNFKGDMQWIFEALNTGDADREDLLSLQYNMDRVVEKSVDWTAKFRAAGATRMYFVAGLSDWLRPVPFIVVKATPGLDEKTLTELFADMDSSVKSAKIGGALVFGGEETVARLSAALPAKPRPEFTTAMTAGRQAPMCVVFVPPASARKQLEQMFPEFGRELGGGPMTALSRNVQWAVFSIKPPEDPSIDITIQAGDDNGARELKKLVDDAATALYAYANRRAIAVKYARGNFKVKVDGSRLAISLDSRQLHDLISPVALGVTAGGDERYSEVQAHIDAERLAQRCSSYAFWHEKKWPDSLNQLVDEALTKVDLAKMTETDRLGHKRHVVYIKPAHPEQNPAQTILVYESFADGDAPRVIAIGFVDGHAEMIDPADLKKHLEAGAHK